MRLRIASAAMAGTALTVCVFAQAPKPGSELVETMGSVEKPGGGSPLSYSIRLPKGAKPSPTLMPHNRSYGQDLAGGVHLAFSIFRLTSEGNFDPIIAYKATTYGGLETKQEIEKGTYVAVLKPMAGQQSVMTFKRVTKGEHVEVECIGPPAHIETLKAVCASFKVTSPISVGDTSAAPAAAPAARTSAPSRLSPAQEAALRGDLEKMVGNDRSTRRAAALSKFKGGMYCDKVKKQFAFEGKCQFGKPSTLLMPAGDNPLVTDYKLEFDGMTFQLKQAVADFKGDLDKDGFLNVATSVFEGKWGPAKSEPGRLVWPGKGGTIVLEYVGGHWQMRDVMMDAR